MNTSSTRSSSLSKATIAVAFLVLAAKSPSQQPAANIEFSSDIQPILRKSCYSSHAGSDPMGKLNLDIKARALQGGASGLPAIIPGNSRDGNLMKRIRGEEGNQMPMGSVLPPEQVELLGAWIDKGAIWPETASGKHWSYDKPVRPPFVKDTRPDAYERVVDRLLASPHYGERWATPWLDLARYADSNGFTGDGPRVAWPYRDWVIKAFNQNMPFDRFTIEQLAGDLLPHATVNQKVATGFIRGSMVLTNGGSACWHSGFIPSVHQGVPFQRTGDPVNFVSNPSKMTSQTRRRALDLINGLNQEELSHAGDPEISTRIAAYEMAYKMQTSVPELMEVASEPQSIHEMYGATPGESSYANNCLLARRLVERGVRFVQLCHRNWDMHGLNYNEDVINKCPAACRQTDRPTAALIKDLKQRGLLESTLVIWGGEFGRTPMAQPGPFLGRDHHPKAYTVWMAGGGVKQGVSYGETDEFGYNPIVNPVSAYDLNATALHLLGIDHKKLTYRFQGRDFRLTDVEGEVVRGVIA